MRSVIVLGLLAVMCSASFVVAAPNPYSLGADYVNNQTTFTVEEGNSQQCIQFGRAHTYGIQYCITAEGAYMGVLQRTDLNKTFFIWNLPNGTQYCQITQGQGPQGVPGFNGGQYIHDVLVGDKRTHLFREALGRFMSSTFVEAGWEQSGEGHLFLLNNFLSTSYANKNSSTVPLSVWDPPASCAGKEARFEWVPESEKLWKQSHAFFRSGGSAVKFPSPDLIRPIGSSARSLSEFQESEEEARYRKKSQRSPKFEEELLRRSSLPNGGFPTSFNQLEFATPVRNDAGCWSGWAFAAAAAIEVVANVWPGNVVGNTSASWISVQSFLDCSALGAAALERNPSYPLSNHISPAEADLNRGCYHGPVGAALEMINIPFDYSYYLDSDYPYTAVTGTKCHDRNYKKLKSFDWSTCPIYKGTGFNNQTEYEIMLQIQQYGAVVAETTDSAFVDYSGEGVYVNPTCRKGRNHAVAIIGWGEEGGVKYWLAKNSWGANWGDNGYLKIQRGVDMCGIESNVWYLQPTI